MPLVTPLDVVRVRLQSQSPPPSSTLRSSSFLAATSFNGVQNLGVTACCREVFWINNNAQFCLATPNALNPVAAPTHVTAASAASCAVEENERKAFTSTLDGLRKIARNEGVLSLWRGLSPTLVMAIPANVIYFTGYDYLRFNDRSLIKRNIADGYAPLIAGSIARIAAATVISPIEMFRTRMQASSTSNTTVFKETLYGLKEMVKSQGYASLWRGLTLTMWRDVPFSGFYWWGYETVRNALTDFRESSRGRTSEKPSSRSRLRSRSQSRENHTMTFVDSFVAGAVSGAVASVVTTPFDVGKTRQQVYIHANDSSTRPSAKGSTKGMQQSQLRPEERTMPRFLYHIFRTEGVPGLFRGWAARCLKVAPACAIMISSYEIGKKMARNVNGKREE